MSLPTSYLITTKNLEAFFNAVINAQAPERFTTKFLESLEFKSTNDRLLIGVLKALNLIPRGYLIFRAGSLSRAPHVRRGLSNKGAGHRLRARNIP